MLIYTPIIRDPFTYHCFLGYYSLKYLSINYMGEKVITYIFHLFSRVQFIKLLKKQQEKRNLVPLLFSGVPCSVADFTQQLLPSVLRDPRAWATRLTREPVSQAFAPRMESRVFHKQQSGVLMLKKYSSFQPSLPNDERPLLPGMCWSRNQNVKWPTTCKAVPTARALHFLDQRSIQTLSSHIPSKNLVETV